MNSTLIPATQDELDWWTKLATEAPKDENARAVAHEVLQGAAARLISELIVSRSLGAIHKERAEEATRRERANAVLLQRAEARNAEMRRELDDMTTEKNRLLARVGKAS